MAAAPLKAQHLVKTYYDSTQIPTLKEYYFVKSATDTTKNGEYIRYSRESKALVSGYFKDGIKDGIWKEFYPDGKPKIEVPYKNGIKDGVMQTYGPAGKLSSKGLFKNGKLTDSLFTFFSSGRLKSKAWFVNDLPEGEVWEYHSSGFPKQLNTYHNQKPNGPFKEWYENGKPKIEAEYKNGMLTNAYKTYYPTGGLDQISSYDMGEKTGSFKQYNQSGQLIKEGLYRKGKIDGTCKLFFDTGEKRAILNYKDGYLDGTSTYFDQKGVVSKIVEYSDEGRTYQTKEFWPNGKPKKEYTLGKSGIMPLGTWKSYAYNGNLTLKKTFDDMGKLDGRICTYDSTGSPIKEEDYTGGILNGVVTIYHQGTTIPYTKTLYSSNRKNGAFTEYFRSGKIAVSGSYLNDQKTEVWKQFDEDGNLLKEETWRGGRLGRTKNYTPKK